jgi:hypothetical protein
MTATVSSMKDTTTEEQTAVTPFIMGAHKKNNTIERTVDNLPLTMLEFSDI